MYFYCFITAKHYSDTKISTSKLFICHEIFNSIEILNFSKQIEAIFGEHVISIKRLRRCLGRFFARGAVKIPERVFWRSDNNGGCSRRRYAQTKHFGRYFNVFSTISQPLAKAMVTDDMTLIIK